MSSSADDNSVICASEPRADDMVAAAAAARRSTSDSSSDAARRTLEQTRHDVENEHLEIEGIIGDSDHGTVYWGTWRGLEVAIKTVAFQVQPHHVLISERCTLVHTSCLFTCRAAVKQCLGPCLMPPGCAGICCRGISHT